MDAVLEFFFSFLAIAVYGSEEKPRPAIYRCLVVGTTMAGLIWWAGWLIFPFFFAPLPWWIVLILFVPGMIAFYGELEIKRSLLGWTMVGFTCLLAVATFISVA